MINVCSIDWDYFFPDEHPYDWGLNEFPASLLNRLWVIRAGNVPIFTKAFKDRNIALYNFLPDIERINTFWNHIKTKDSSIVITESHAELFKIIDAMEIEITLYNFDAHHDIYSDKNLNCGNFVYHLLNEGYLKPENYHIVYPHWREDSLDGLIVCDDIEKINTYYQIPEDLPIFNIIFICRSGAWTPPWSDDHWINFIQYWKQYPPIWKNKMALPYVLQKRDFDIKAAETVIKEEKEWREKIK